MLNRKQRFGKYGEAVAVRQLKKMGYRILAQNYRTRLGEIDIIAKDKDTLVFVEVKSRASSVFGGPKQAVTPAKQRRISRNALYYLKETCQHNVKARFDVVAIRSEDRKTSVEVIKNAFELAG
jgi:putative endonuclease